MTSKIQELRRDFSFDSKSKMVLLLSFATDEMIKEVQKNPEVWFMDVTSGANIQKRDLFIMVVRKPDGTCFYVQFIYGLMLLTNNCVSQQVSRGYSG